MEHAQRPLRRPSVLAAGDRTAYDLVERFTLTQCFWAQIGPTLWQRLRTLFIGNDQGAHSLGWAPGCRRSRRKRKQAQKRS